jgi:predicted RNA-binding Zn ribbon-like protein
MADVRPAPLFLADDLALDFLNSIASPAGEPIEWLANGEDLIAWLRQAGIVAEPVAAEFRSRTGPRALDAVATQARELREWFRGFVRSHAGKPLSRTALRELEPLNELLESDETYRQVVAVTPGARGLNGADVSGALRWETVRRWRAPKSLLLPIAAAIGDIVCRADFTFVRHCEGQGCTLWFLDVSKGHGRRWCSMAVCGNRAKAAAHRARGRPS